MSTNPAAPRSVAIIGTGVIGRSWLRVFTRAGCEVRAWDPNAETLDQALEWHHHEVAREGYHGWSTRKMAVVHTTGSLAEALGDADYVQESGPEKLEIKKSIYAELNRLAPRNAILASSTSALDMTAIAEGLSGADRCVTAHPVNPPHVVPAVEVLGGKATARATIDRTVEIQRAVGQRPVVLERYVPGFLVNRLQMALFREALSLFIRGVADADAIDSVIRDGLGLRWALLGPFGVGDTNADGGIRDYLTRYRPSIEMLMADLGPSPKLDDDLIAAVGASTDAMAGGVERAELREWRDRLVREIVALREKDRKPGSGPG